MFKCEKIPLILRIFRNPNKTESFHILDKGSAVCWIQRQVRFVLLDTKTMLKFADSLNRKDKGINVQVIMLKVSFLLA